MYYLTENQFNSLRNTANRNDVMDEIARQLLKENNQECSCGKKADLIICRDCFDKRAKELNATVE